MCLITRYCVCFLALVFILPGVQENLTAQDSATQATSDAFADRIAEGLSAPGGMAVLVEPADHALAVAVAQQGSFVVHLLLEDSQSVEKQRRALRNAGRLGDVSAHVYQGATLPYTDNLINLLIVDSVAAQLDRGLTLAEMLRVVTPLGELWCGSSRDTAIDGEDWKTLANRARTWGCTVEQTEGVSGRWFRIIKPFSPETDQWTHFLHGADGNPVADDQVVGPPRHYQWTGDPIWLRSHETDSSVSTMVTAQGRLFSIVDEAPIGVAGDHDLPDKWFLRAHDAFNGVPLWKVPIRRWGWREWKYSWFATRPGDYPFDIRKRLVAVGDRVYVTLGYRAPVSELDARTGEILRTFSGTESTSELMVADGQLLLSVHEEDSLRIMAIDLASGTVAWRSSKTYAGTTTDYLKWTAMRGSVRAPKLSPAANLATAGGVAALIDGDQIVGLDARSGRQLWREPFPENEDDQFAGGIQANGMLWNGTMIVQDGVVLHASPQLLGALSAKTGKLLWVQPKKYIGHLWYEWKDVFVIEGLVWTWSAELVKGNIDVGGGKQQRQQWPKSIQGYDLHSGELKKEVPLGNIFRTHHHHRCYRNKATTRYVLASRRGTEYVDLLKGQHTVDNWVRGTCHVGMMPANGLQYVPPHPCQCYIEEKLVGFNALASRMAEPGKLLTDDQRFLVGPVHSKRSEEALHESAADSEQWPTFRHDGARTGSVSTKVPDDHRVLWVAQLGGNLTAPTVAGGHMFVCQQDQHNLVCLAAEDGRHEWDFAAGARIDSPPTYHLGRVLFGSRDGWVYCLDADSGELQWCYHVAPRQRWIGAFGQLESAWPVHGSLLVQNNVVYAVAGRSSQLDDGLFLVGLDVSSGELLYENHLQGPFYQVDELEQNYRLPMGALPDILVGDGERVFMRSRSFDNELQAAVAKPALQVPGGLLEDSYFKRTPWRSASGDYGRVAVRDKRSTYFVRQFDSLEGLNPSVFFTPGQQGYLLYASNHHPESRSWRTRIPVRIRAMVLANDRLFVAGPPDVVEPDDPLGAFEGRKGGVLTVFNAQTGEQFMTHALTSSPVFNGAAAACERLYIVDDRGAVTCFGAP